MKTPGGTKKQPLCGRGIVVGRAPPQAAGPGAGIEAGGGPGPGFSAPPSEDLAHPARTLTERGAQVEYAECYRRVRPQADAAPLLAEWQRGAVDAVTVFSVAALENLVAMLGAGARRLEATPVFVPHPRVAEAARRHG